MGSFFTNTQVRPYEGQSRADVIEALEAIAGEQGYVRSEVPADRGVVVGPRRATGWMAIWDEATEGQDGAMHAEFARALSSTCDAVVSVLVHDSDALHLELFQRGSSMGSLEHGIDLQTGRHRVGAKAARDPWLSLVHEADAPRLHEALDSRDVFGPEVLHALTKLFGWNDADARTGFRYLARDSHLDDGQATRLHFRLLERPAWETPAEGPPVYMKQGYQPCLEAKKGARVELHHSASSMGGAGKGLVVTLRGAAIESVNFSPKTVLLRFGGEMPFAEAEAPVEPNGGERIARFPDFEIPAGLTDPYGAMRGNFDERVFAEFQKRHVHVFIRGRATRAGEGELSVSIAPAENAEVGSAHFDVHLQVD